MHGSSSTNAPAIYGTQGVAATSNDPVATYESCEWTDLSGNFWLFGGLDMNLKEHGALWMFNPTTNLWTWMNGPTAPTNAGVYGIQGVPAASNAPGARAWGATTWVDQTGNLWLFGGSGYDVTGTLGGLADLWKYTISTNMWTWVSGSNTSLSPGSYGSMNVSSPANCPPSRSETNASWVDANGNLWLFGGFLGPANSYNDLWKFDLSTNQWTWMHGSNLPNQAGSYGTRGIAAASNDPSGRFVYSKFKDVSGNFWIFGGANTNTLSNNDLWKYDPVAGMWTWVNGSNFNNDPGNPGTQCLFASSNVPMARFENRACWTDPCGDFYTFGGVNVVAGSGATKAYNDLWHYNVASNQWVLVSGSSLSNPPGSWGSMTVPASTNMPDGRFGSAPFKDNSGNLWLFGGYATWSPSPHMHNDLWRFTPDTTCGWGHTCPVAVKSNFSASSLNGCAPFKVNFVNLSTSANTYTWDFGDGGANQSFSPIHVYSNPGTYTVSLIASNGITTDTMTFINYINVFPSPKAIASASLDSVCPGQIISFTNSSIGSSSYTWNFGDGSSSIINAPSHSWTNSGIYTVTLVVANPGRCSDSTKIPIHILKAKPLSVSFKGDTIGCPNVAVHFLSSTVNATAYIWSFGDGGVSNAVNPTYTYTASGVYAVILTCYGFDPCGQDTVKAMSAIHILVPKPISAAFKSDTTVGCSPSSIHFTSTTVNVTGFFWNFGDGGTSTSANPVHTYLASGLYTVSLSCYGNDPCGPDTVQVVNTNYIDIIHNSVKASFSSDSLPGCSPLHLSFTDNSINANAWLWKFGDGGTSNAQNPVHDFYAGNWTIQLIAYSNTVPCPVQDSLTKIAYIVADTCQSKLIIPNVFSPDGDGKNDIFYVTAEGFSAFHIEIYDRWGARIFVSDDLNDQWNGKIHNNGQEAAAGTYYYLLNITDSNKHTETYKGFLTLFRNK